MLVRKEIPDVGCSKCDRGRIRIPKTGEGEIGFTVQICECLVENESLRYSMELLANSNLTSRYIKEFTVENWEEPVEIPFDILKEIVAGGGDKRWLFIHGAPGTGKTYSAVIASQIALLQEKSVYFTTVADLLRDLRPDDSDPDKAGRTMRACKKAGLLVLDDIGHEKTSAWVREQLYIIINHRWGDLKPTIFTSNYGIENITKSISSAVYSRVKGESLEVHLTAKKDRRLL